MPIVYERVRDLQRFHDLRLAWHALWKSSGASIFQSHAWIVACQPPRLNLALAWQGGELLAALPLAIRQRSALRVLEWAGQPFNDYCDGMVQPYHDVLLQYLWEQVRRAGGFDLIWLKQIGSEANFYNIAQNGYGSLKTNICLRVTNQWSSGEAWFRTLNKKTRNDHLRGKRIISQEGELVFREWSPQEPLEPLLQWAMNLKRQWLVTTGNTSPLFADTSILPALVAALLEVGVLKIFLLECGSTPIAISINAVQDEVMLAFFATYDPVHERGSPGIVLMTHYTMWAFDHGIKVVDYLRGEEPYKFKFANSLVETKACIGARTMRGRLALLAYHWTNGAKPATRPQLGSAYLTPSGKLRA